MPHRLPLLAAWALRALPVHISLHGLPGPTPLGLGL
jgi:hypothetical protein